MKTIIAPTDFSSISDNACMYAAKMAEEINAELILLHAIELPIAVAEYPVTENLFDQAGMEKELEALKMKLSAATNNKVKIQTKNILSSPEYEIKELCKTKKPFAVVMGTHRYSSLDRFFLGSTTLYTAKHLQYPVLVIPSTATYKPLKKIALATDLEDIYNIPVHEIETIINLFNAELEIFYVGKNEKNADRKSLGSVLLDHRLVHLQPQFYFIENEDILKGVTSLAKEHATDILMIIPKKHGPFHKSKSKDFIFYADIPVMAIHENDMVEQA
jgi:nucleotide-binding universal stress UspA family protein